MSANKQKTITRTVHTLDARGAILGRLATSIADLLRGKQDVNFTAHIDSGNYVTVINAKDIKVTGRKLEQKTYYSHSGTQGNLREKTLGTLMDESPELVITRAVYGMLPKNRLRVQWMKRLKVYAGEKN